MDITSSDKYLEIDGTQAYQKGSAYRIYEAQAPYTGVVVHFENGVERTFRISDTTINGVAPVDLAELYDFLKENLFLDGGGAGLGAQKATMEQMQEGTDDVDYVTPFLVYSFVSWFSEDLVITDDTEYENPLTSSEMNTKYPDARVRTVVYMRNVADTSLKYTKINTTEWESTPYAVA